MLHQLVSRHLSKFFGAAIALSACCAMSSPLLAQIRAASDFSHSLVAAGGGGYGDGGPVDEPGLADVVDGSGLAAGSGSALPYVMGDTPGFGGCGRLDVGGLNAMIGHPLFGCSRLNLAENGTPLPNDRLFVTYRHFDRPTRTDIFGNDAVLDVDRITFGLERTLFDGWMSVEVRVPFNYQLSPIIDITDLSPAPTTGIPVDDRNFELGNVGMAFKFLVYETCNWAVSSGFGLGLPTARSVSINADLDNTYTIGGGPGAVDAMITSLIGNDTVYMTPYVGAVYTPARRWFAQGFFQIDVPLNKTQANLGIDDQGGTLNDFSDSTEISWQTLMRVNGQLGAWIYDRCGRTGYIDRIAALMEVHWTGTLNDADIQSFNLGTINATPIDLTIGNTANRVDIVNLGLGTAIQAGCSDLNTGFVIPLTDGDNDPFDWEFVATLNRRF